ncbi:hypothetical protein [Pedobacter steynii]
MIKNGKTAVVYLSMGFGNPYGDEWNIEIVEKWAAELVANGVKILSLSDTTGVSSPEKSGRFYHLWLENLRTRRSDCIYTAPPIRVLKRLRLLTKVDAEDLIVH